MLSLGDGAAISVRVGDRLPGGIQVKGVERDHLWLQRGEEQALLYVQRADLARPSPPETPAVMEQLVPPGCESYAAAGVPEEELITLGGCPLPEGPAAW